MLAVLCVKHVGFIEGYQVMSMRVLPDISNIMRRHESGSRGYLTGKPSIAAQILSPHLGTLPQVPVIPQASLSHTFLRSDENTIPSLKHKYVDRKTTRIINSVDSQASAKFHPTPASMADRLGDNAENSKSPSLTRRDSQTAEKVSRACDNCKSRMILEYIPV